MVAELNKKYNIHISVGRCLWLWLVRYSNIVLVFLGLRKRKKFWGIVYDSVTKQPLDPAIVKIAYLGENHVETCVTDLEGNYGFLAHPGKFKLLARKTNYTFPSKLAPSDHDGIYDNLYHGEFFKLQDDYDVIAPNIPMDPVSFDWNQQAKLDRTRKYPYTKFLFKQLILIFFWFGFVFFLLQLWKHFGAQHIVWLYSVLAGYVIIFLFDLITPDLRLWGRLKQKFFYDGRLLLELAPVQLPGVVMGKTEVRPGGKFLLRAKKGNYYVTLKHEEQGIISVVGKTTIAVGSEGVVNQTITVSRV